MHAHALNTHAHTHTRIYTLAVNELFLAHKEYQLAAYIAEDTGTRGPSRTASYYGTAVVKADQCGEGKPFTGFNKESLEVHAGCCCPTLLLSACRERPPCAWFRGLGFKRSSGRVGWALTSWAWGGSAAQQLH